MVVKLILITCHYNLQGIDKERSWMEQNTEKDSISEHFLPHRVTDEGHPDYHSRLWRPTTSCWTRSLPSIPQHYYYVHLCVDLESILSWLIFQVTVRSWVAIPIFPIDHLQWEYLNVFKLIVIGLGYYRQMLARHVSCKIYFRGSAIGGKRCLVTME